MAMIALPLDMESGPTQLKRLTPALSVKLRTSGEPEFPKVTQLNNIFPVFFTPGAMISTSFAKKETLAQRGYKIIYKARKCFSYFALFIEIFSQL